MSNKRRHSISGVLPGRFRSVLPTLQDDEEDQDVQNTGSPVNKSRAESKLPHEWSEFKQRLLNETKSKLLSADRNTNNNLEQCDKVLQRGSDGNLKEFSGLFSVLQRRSSDNFCGPSGASDDSLVNHPSRILHRRSSFGNTLSKLPSTLSRDKKLHDDSVDRNTTLLQRRKSYGHLPDLSHFGIDQCQDSNTDNFFTQSNRLTQRRCSDGNILNIHQEKLEHVRKTESGLGEMFSCKSNKTSRDSSFSRIQPVRRHSVASVTDHLNSMHLQEQCVKYSSSLQSRKPLDRDGVCLNTERRKQEKHNYPLQISRMLQSMQDDLPTSTLLEIQKLRKELRTGGHAEYYSYASAS